jgi:hypothetical protein
MTYLVETNIVGIFTEALTADVQVILADQAGLMGADTAKKVNITSVTKELNKSAFFFLVRLTGRKLEPHQEYLNSVRCRQNWPSFQKLKLAPHCC